MIIPSQSPLTDQVSAEVGAELQATLVELIALSLLGKQLHWNVVGPAFHTLHTQLDEFVDSWRELSDGVAERGAAIDVPPDGRITVVAEGVIGHVEAGPVNAETAVHVISAQISAVAKNVRSRLDRMGELDLSSQDVLVGVSRALEQQLWRLRAQLKT